MGRYASWSVEMYSWELWSLGGNTLVIGFPDLLINDVVCLSSAKCDSLMVRKHN